MLLLDPDTSRSPRGVSQPPRVVGWSPPTAQTESKPPVLKLLGGAQKAAWQKQGFGVTRGFRRALRRGLRRTSESAQTGICSPMGHWGSAPSHTRVLVSFTVRVRRP